MVIAGFTKPEAAAKATLGRLQERVVRELTAFSFLRPRIPTEITLVGTE